MHIVLDGTFETRWEDVALALKALTGLIVKDLLNRPVSNLPAFSSNNRHGKWNVTCFATLGPKGEDNPFHEYVYLLFHPNPS
jgi:hypothetical protein